MPTILVPDSEPTPSTLAAAAAKPRPMLTVVTRKTPDLTTRPTHRATNPLSSP